MAVSSPIQPPYHRELEVLKQRLLAMGGFAEEQLRAVMGALVARDAPALEKIYGGDEPINSLHIEIDSRAFGLLSTFRPDDSDLRAVVAAIKMNADLERVGDLVVNIAEAANRYVHQLPVKPLHDLPRMAELAQHMLGDALDAFVRRDTDLAESVLARDDELDLLKSRIFQELLAHMHQDRATIEPSLELILISRHLERIGDHATNIAEDVIFVVTARDVRHAAPGGR